MARFAMAVAGALPAAERQVRLGARGPGIDVDDARLEVAHGPEGEVHVPREDARREPEAGLVGGHDRSVVVGHADDREGGAEDLLLAQAVHGLDAIEDGGGAEVAVLAARAIRGGSAADHETALRAADPRVGAYLLERGSLDERAR